MDQGDSKVAVTRFRPPHGNPFVVALVAVLSRPSIRKGCGEVIRDRRLFPTLPKLCLQGQLADETQARSLI